MFGLGKNCGRFRFNIKFFWLCFIFFCLLVFLSAWQLQRYYYKKNLLIIFQQRITAPPVAITILPGVGVQFQHIKVSGHYLNHLTVLLQNRFYQGRPGFEVLTPLKLHNQQKLVLIDRGWVPAPFVKLFDILGEQNITGTIQLLNEYQFILGKNVLSAAKPIVMQKIDLAELSQLQGKNFYSYVVRLDKNSPNGFVRDWTLTSMAPERHLGYAVQWLVMALVLLIAYLNFCFER